MDRREFEELSAGHALDALDRADETIFLAERAAHPEWEEISRRDHDTVASLADAVATVPPPAGLRAVLLAEISRDRDRVREEPGDPLPELIDAASRGSGPLPTEIVQTVARRTWTRGILALAASVVLLAVVGFGSAWLGGRIFPQTAENVALEQIERSADGRQSAPVSVQGGGEAVAHWSESLGQAVLVIDGVARLEDAQTYELWLVRDGTTLAAGLFDVGAEGQATTVLDGIVQRGDSIAVTVEPAGGSLDGVPSSDPLVVIPTGAV